MCFSFSVVMVRSEPEVLANKGATCCHCRLRHHDHGHRQHQCGLLIPAENTMRGRFEQPMPRDRRRRAHSRSVSRHRHRRARSPRRRRRSRTPAVRRQEQTGPSPPPGNWHPAPAPQFPPPRPLLPHQHYMPPPRQAHMYAPPGWFSAHMQWPAASFPPHPQSQQFKRPADVQPEQRPPVQGSQAPQPDTRKPAVPLTPPQRKSADPKPESKQAENAPSSSQVLPRPTASKAQLAQVARSSSNELAPAETQPVDEQFLRDLMSANLADVESQLELQLEGRTAVDHIPDGLSTLSQYLLLSTATVG